MTQILEARCQGEDGDADRLFELARSGDPAAWEALVDKCYEKVRRVVGRKLDPPMRSLYDSTDFANDVFKSLVAQSDRLSKFQSIDALEAHLICAAKQKVIDECRRQHRQKRDIRRDRRLDAGEYGYEPPASDPSPSQVAQAVEAHDLLLAGQSEADREVIRLKSEDYNNEEIAERTGQHVRKVQRLLKKVHDSWFTAAGGRRS